jgi:hypothetical protein
VRASLCVLIGVLAIAIGAATHVDDLNVATAIALVWQVVPFLVLALAVSRRAIAYPTALLAIAISTLGVVETTRVGADQSSSTSALAFIWFPFWLIVINASLIVADRVVRRTARRFHESQVRTPMRGRRL